MVETSGNLRDLGVNLVAAVVAFIAGLTFRWAVGRLSTRRARHFWGAMAGRRPTLLLGAFTEFGAFEPSGLLGVADARAAVELIDHLGRLNMTGYDVAYANNLSLGALGHDLICFGGPDSNDISRRILEEVDVGLEFTSAPTAVKDKTKDQIYSAELHADAVTVDYGAFIRVDNPFQRECKSIIIAGGYGYGTWAGVLLLRDHDFLASVRHHENFVCIYRVDVIQHLPQRVEVQDLRGLEPSAT